ncbi:MAG: putative metal-binding motif-containing protein, partial [Myxococcota bacterium]
MLVLLALAGCLIDTERYEGRKDALTDHDGDGFARADDCDDGDATVFPGAEEVCDGVLQDCDGAIDADAVDASDWYMDADVDGFGAGVPVTACEAPGGHVANALDCDDSAIAVHPGADEVPYDGVDDDCDGVDLDDVDGDGYRAERVGGDDCDDGAAEVHPDAVDAPYDGIDQDCVAGDLDDLDGDGHAALDAGGDDCDDADPAVFGEAPETWADGFTDNDCDDEIEAVTLVYGTGVWTGTRAGGELGRRVGPLGDVTGDGG